MTELAPTLPLSGSARIPQLGLGTYKIPDADAPAAVRSAIEIGYRHIDTATLYGNEAGVGEGVRQSGIERDAIFVTTKVWQDSHGYDQTLRSFDDSLARLGFEQVDLFLIHWPAPEQNRYVETWQALLRLRDEGRARAVGVANFTPQHLQRLIDETGEVPEINQVELHLAFQQPQLREWHRKHGILTEAWAPLDRGNDLARPQVMRLAQQHGCTPAQLVLAWHLALGNVVIPKSVQPNRQRENFEALSVRLDAADLATLAELDEDVRGGKDPDNFH